VYHCPQTGIYFVSDFETVTKIAKDHATFSNRFALAATGDQKVDPRITEIQAQGYPPVDTMLTQDPPVHRRYRGMVNQAFTARRVATLEPEIEKVCHELIDKFIDRGEAEFIVEFCEPVPMIVIAEQLGVPLSDYELFKSWSDAFVAQLSRMATPDEEVEAAKLILAYQHYFVARIEERRADPHDDIISDIVHAKFEDERPLNIPEMLSIIQQLLVAGNETTTNAIAEAVLMWTQYPDQFAKLKANRDLVPNLVEETLRLSTPTANMWRVVTTDTEIQGTPVPAGSMVQIRFSSANRDESKFPDPHRFDVERENAKSNIAFGYGVHMCIGASLARKEMDVAFRVLLERFDEFELACDPAELTYAPNVLLRGLSRLPVRFNRT
jgi:cytochrome P450